MAKEPVDPRVGGHVAHKIVHHLGNGCLAAQPPSTSMSPPMATISLWATPRTRTEQPKQFTSPDLSPASTTMLRITLRRSSDHAAVASVDTHNQARKNPRNFKLALLIAQLLFARKDRHAHPLAAAAS
ncbi:MAG TPA: hypothetical protein VKE24_13420 [Candidatus Acidoferrales bacterium]|nr:hypothetical protein [Candidatus Acidoferrales bacterium]